MGGNECHFSGAFEIVISMHTCVVQKFYSISLNSEHAIARQVLDEMQLSGSDLQICQDVVC